jgi:hypothetical protein
MVESIIIERDSYKTMVQNAQKDEQEKASAAASTTAQGDQSKAMAAPAASSTPGGEK